MESEFPLSHPRDKRRRKDGAPADFSLSQAVCRSFRVAIWAPIVALGLSRFLWLAADFPNNSPWMIDQAKFTDEGWWANAAVMHALSGRWHIAGDYNPAAALPIWPLLLGAVFHFTGVSIVAARALSVGFSLATLGVIYLLVRRYAASLVVAEVAVLLMAASPFAFVFSRIAILDSLVVLEFCLMLLVASQADKGHFWPLASLTLLVTAALLTKTTSAVLVPAVMWIAFCASQESTANGRGWRSLMRALLAAGVAPLALLKLWALIVSWLGYGADYHFFFTVNAMPDIDWRQTFHWLQELALNGFWIDRLLYPLALAILVASITLRRRLWRNPLFAASWLAIAGEALFIFSRQDDYAPRYFLAMLAPVIFIVVLAFDHFLRSSRIAAGLLAAGMAVAVVANSVAIVQVLAHREYQLYGAAHEIAAAVRADHLRSQLLFGVSAAEIGLIDGLPSINGSYGIDDMAQKVARYKPGWYLAWNDDIDHDAIAGRTIVPAAGFHIFDDDGRNFLVLYKME